MQTPSNPPKAGSSAGALWSLFWRAVLLTPAAVLFGGLFITAWSLIFVLPLLEILYLWEGNWHAAMISPVVWIASFVLTRSRWFRPDRKEYLNDQENV
jgi:hypothetical protein